METHVNVVRDACLRHAGHGSAEEQEEVDGVLHDHGLTAAQFQAACADLAREEDFGEFKKLADNEGLSSAVFSRCGCWVACRPCINAARFLLGVPLFSAVPPTCPPV